VAISSEDPEKEASKSDHDPPRGLQSAILLSGSGKQEFWKNVDMSFADMFDLLVAGTDLRGPCDDVFDDREPTV